MVHLLRQDKPDLDILLGEPKRAIRSMVLPFFIAMFVVEINQFIDTYWVSGLGNVSAEAVATVVPIYGLMMCAGLGVSIGATTSISYRIGRGEMHVAGRLVSNSIILGVILAIIASILVFISFDWIIDIMGAGNVRAESWSYMLPYLVLSPAILVNSVIGGCLRGEGAARKSTIVQISAAVLNMIFDPILIYGLGMGNMGAGLATCLSALAGVIIGVAWYAKGKCAVKVSRSDIVTDKEAAKEILGVGGPKAVQLSISNITDLIQRVFLIMAGGTTAIILYNYPWRYIGVVNLPGRALDSAMIPVCSTAYGQDDLKKMKTGYLYTVKLSLIISIIGAIILFIFAEPLMSIMTQEETMQGILPKLVWTMRVAVFLIPFAALMGIGSSMLQSMKKARISMYFYMLWAFLKLGLYALAAYGYLGVDPFDGIIYCMVAIHVFGGTSLVGMGLYFFNRISKEKALQSDMTTTEDESSPGQ